MPELQDGMSKAYNLYSPRKVSSVKGRGRRDGNTELINQVKAVEYGEEGSTRVIKNFGGSL